MYKNKTHRKTGTEHSKTCKADIDKPHTSKIVLFAKETKTEMQESSNEIVSNSETKGQQCFTIF